MSPAVARRSRSRDQRRDDIPVARRSRSAAPKRRRLGLLLASGVVFSSSIAAVLLIPMVPELLNGRRDPSPELVEGIAPCRRASEQASYGTVRRVLIQR